MTINIEAPKRVTFTFQEIDDKVKVYVNNNEVFNHGIKRHNEVPANLDITNELKAGPNQVRVLAENGPGWAVLIGSMDWQDEDGQTGNIKNWNIRQAHHPDPTIVDETVEINYTPGTHGAGKKIKAIFSQIDDALTIYQTTESEDRTVVVNRETPLRNGDTPMEETIPLKPGYNRIDLIAKNHIGHGVLIGSLKLEHEDGDMETIEEWNISEAHHPNDIVAEYTFEFEHD